MDLILTNMPKSFQSTCFLETELSDLHLMTLTALQKDFQKLVPKIMSCRSYKHFANEAFSESLLNELKKAGFVNNDNDFKRFCY